MYPIPAISQKSVLWCHLSSRNGTRSTPRTHPLPGDTRRQDCKPGTCWNIDRDAWNAVWEFENIQQSFLYFHFLFFTFLLVLVPSPPSLQVCELTMLLTACISPSVTRVSSSTFVLPDSSQLLFSFSILKACFFFFFFFPSITLREKKIVRTPAVSEKNRFPSGTRVCLLPRSGNRVTCLVRGEKRALML